MPGPLADPVSKIIAAFLIAKGVGPSPTVSPVADWAVYYDEEPTDPDSCVTVGNTAPVRNECTFDGEVYERQGVIVRVRSSDGDAGYVKADSIRELFDKTLPNTYLVGANLYRIHRITRTTGVTAVGRTLPVSDRLAWTINALVNLRKI